MIIINIKDGESLDKALKRFKKKFKKTEGIKKSGAFSYTRSFIIYLVRIFAFEF